MAALASRSVMAFSATAETAFRPSTPVGRGKDRKSTRLNSSHTVSSYAGFCLKKKNDVVRLVAAPERDREWIAGTATAPFGDEIAVGVDRQRAHPGDNVTRPEDGLAGGAGVGN